MLLEIDNNGAERSINHLLLGVRTGSCNTPKGARASATIYRVEATKIEISVANLCKGLDPWPSS